MIIEVSLLVALLASHFFYMREIQKLVNKLMSRDFYEYQKAAKIELPPQGITIPDYDKDPPEDLRTLQEFKMI